MSTLGKSRKKQSAKKPDIGFNSARDYFDSLLLPAYRNFAKTPKRVSMVEFARSAWHLNERLWHDRGKPNKEKFLADLLSACPELRLVRDIGDTSKHTELERRSATLARIEGCDGGGTGEEITIYGAVSKPDRGTLTIVEDNGARHDPDFVFKRIVEFWQAEIAK
jgi:hypothetical protein